MQSSNICEGVRPQNYSRRRFLRLIGLGAVSLAAPGSPTALETPAMALDLSTPTATPDYTYRVIKTYTHDRRAYTQGLVFDHGVLYEGTGKRGHSELRRLNLGNGEVLQARKLPSRFFGEGITIYGETVIQLTWLSRVGFVYDKSSFELLKQFDYHTEGWGITNDGTRLIMSDGSSQLTFLNKDTFEFEGSIDVRLNHRPVPKLNELEYIRGEIFANIWQTDRIARIDPKTGDVIGLIDLSGLLRLRDRFPPVDVLNGIAFDKEKGRIFVTGKLWPKIFEIELLLK